MTRMTTFLQRSAWVAWLLLLSSIAGLGWMMLDNKPPFEMLGYERVDAIPGTVAKINVTVQRDLTRRCSVTFSRHMFDSAGTRIDLVGNTQMTADALEQLDRTAPGRLRLAVPIPEYAAYGPAKLVTTLSYVCNAWHGIRPIETTMVINLDVIGGPQ